MDEVSVANGRTLACPLEDVCYAAAAKQWFASSLEGSQPFPPFRPQQCDVSCVGAALSSEDLAMAPPINREIQEWSVRVAAFYAQHTPLMPAARVLLEQEEARHLTRAVAVGDDTSASWPRYANKALDEWEAQFPTTGPRVSVMHPTGTINRRGDVPSEAE